MNPIVQQIAKHPLVALLATIVVGSLGSGFWDIAVKPGIGWVGSALLNIITLGSESIRDNAYAAATMEPTSIPSLKLYLLLLCFLSTPILFSLLLPSINPRKVARHVVRREGDSETDVGTDPPEDSDLSWAETFFAGLLINRKRVLRFRLIAVAIVGILLGIMFYEFAVMNQSVLIWRAFNSDIRSCAPFLSEEEEEVIWSQFAQVKTKSDYGEILDRLQSIAAQNELSLYSERLW